MIILLAVLLVLGLSASYWGGQVLKWLLAPGVSMLLRLLALPFLLAYAVYRMVIAPYQLAARLPGYYRKSTASGIAATFLLIIAILAYLFILITIPLAIWYRPA